MKTEIQLSVEDDPESQPLTRHKINHIKPIILSCMICNFLIEIAGDITQIIIGHDELLNIALCNLSVLSHVVLLCFSSIFLRVYSKKETIVDLELFIDTIIHDQVVVFTGSLLLAILVLSGLGSSLFLLTAETSVIAGLAAFHSFSFALTAVALLSSFIYLIYKLFHLFYMFFQKC